MSKDRSGHFKGTKGDKKTSPDSGGKVNQLPPNDSQLKHIFRDAEGHLPDTPENRELVTNMANNPANYMGMDKYGNQWYSSFNASDGSQLWASVRNGRIQNAGKNLVPHTWDDETGYSQNPKKDKSWRKKK